MTVSAGGGDSNLDAMTLPAAVRSQPLSDALSGKIGWIAAALIGAAYVACIVRLTSYPMQDYANHLARADVMADILFHHGARFGQVFQVHLTPVPYVLPDLILMCAVEVFGVAAGAGVFTGLVLLSLPVRSSFMRTRAMSHRVRDRSSSWWACIFRPIGSLSRGSWHTGSPSR